MYYIMYIMPSDSSHVRAHCACAQKSILERAHNVQISAIEFINPKNLMIDTKNIEIGSLEV